MTSNTNRHHSGSGEHPPASQRILPSTSFGAVARVLLVVGFPLVSFALGPGLLALFRSDLPDPLASHFDATGQPDGSMSVSGLITITAVAVAIGSLASIAVGLRGQPWRWHWPLGALGPFTAVFFAGIATSTVISQMNLDSWRDAPNPIGFMLLVTVVAVGAMVLGAWASNQLPRYDESLTAEDLVGRLPLDPGQRAVWHGGATNKWLRAAGPVMLVVVLTHAALRVRSMGQVPPVAFQFESAILVLTGIVVTLMGTLRARVDERGLRVSYGPFGWPRVTITGDRIQKATAIDVRALQWGGWGYRGSLRLFGRAAAVQRGGEGVKVQLRDNKTFVVTVDHADDAAALLNTLFDTTHQPR